jgi:hypothetical protein
VISKRVQAAVVVLFVLVIAGVVAWLLMRVDSDPPAVDDESADSGNELDSAAADPVGGVSLTAGKGDLVVRVTAGSCQEPGGPKLELSENQSRTFRQILLPQIDDGSGVSAASPTVHAIAWVRATSPYKVTVLAADSKCVVHQYSTSDSGASWKQEPGKVARWYKDPATETVVAPTGPVKSGCEGVVSVMPFTKKNAKVFCADGAIRTTSDGGDTWIDVGRLPGTSVAVFTGPLTGYASVAEGKCKSRIHATVDGGITWVPRGCVHEEFILPGLTGTEKRLVAGGTAGMRLSTDGGTTWKPPTMK